MKSGPIILIEDDKDDLEIFEEVLVELRVKNKLVWFNNFEDAYSYFKTTLEKPCIIFCDINIAGHRGTEFKSRIDADPQLRKKSIPFVFYSTSVDQDTVNEAYTKMTVQGFFMKESSFEDVKKVISAVLNYWDLCKHPNTF